MTPVLPGATLGVLGSGQLGRMFAIEARKMGYRVHTFSPGRNTPTGQVADLEIVAPYDDLDAVARFARDVDVVTFEFENVHTDTAQVAAEIVPCRPKYSILHTTQNRLREKSFLRDRGFPVTDFARIGSDEELTKATSQIGSPSILKSASWGYDGKGQSIVRDVSDIASAWDSLGKTESILERYVEFELEMSVVVARGLDGNSVHYELTHNRHVDGILDVSSAPMDLDPRTRDEAGRIADAIADEFGLVGVMCVEMFLTTDERILVNEIAPRPHNSGHWTFDAAVTSQFEQQVRSICGLPLGSPALLRPVAMANLLGDLWSNGEPDWSAAVSNLAVTLHLYGKSDARSGRKMGHLTAMASSVDEAEKIVLEARQRLSRR